MTEAQYNSALAIYNPNGGHRTGKVYDVRNTVPAKNLFTNSESFTSWSKGGYVITSNFAPSPTGVGQATRIVGTGGGHYMGEGIITNTDTQYTISMWVKSNGGGNVFRLFVADILVSSDLTATTEWVRYSFTANVTASGSIRLFGINRGNANADHDLLIFGAQLEISPTVTSYDKKPRTDLTVTGGGGTRVNKAGLVEDVKSKNLFVRSLDFSHSSWTKSVTIINQNSLSPTGSLDATEMSVSAGSNRLYQLVYFPVPTGTIVTISVWIRTLTGTMDVQLGYNGASQPNNTVGSAIQTVTTTWQRFSYSISLTDDNGLYGMPLYYSSGGTIQIWGAQMEIGALTDFKYTGDNNLHPKIDNSTGSPAILVEPTRTNSIPWSNDFTKWTAANSTPTITANNAISPDGTQNASLITGTGGLYYLAGGSGDAFYSVWLKSPDANNRTVKLSDAWGGNVITELVCNVTPQWQRFSVLCGAGGTGKGLYIKEIPASGVLAYEAQTEMGNTLTSNIRTGGAAVTRTETGLHTAVSGVPTRFGMYMDFYNKPVAVTRLMGIGKSQKDYGAGGIRMFKDAAGVLSYLVYDNNGNNQGTTATGVTLVNNARNKLLVIRDSATQWLIFHNGTKYIVNSFSFDAINLDTLFLGSEQYYKADNIIYDFQLLPSKTDAEAIALTTI